MLASHQKMEELLEEINTIFEKVVDFINQQQCLYKKNQIL